mgnify:CR=1 FL=1
MQKYSVDQAYRIARDFGLVKNKKVFYRWVNEGRVPSVKTPTRRHIPIAEFNVWIAKNLPPGVVRLLQENKRLKEELQKQNHHPK